MSAPVLAFTNHRRLREGPSSPIAEKFRRLQELDERAAAITEGMIDAWIQHYEDAGQSSAVNPDAIEWLNAGKPRPRPDGQKGA